MAVIFFKIYLEEGKRIGEINAMAWEFSDIIHTLMLADNKIIITRDGQRGCDISIFCEKNMKNRD